MTRFLALSVAAAAVCCTSVARAQTQRMAPSGTAAQAQQAALPSVTLPPAIDRVLRDYERAWRARDEKALAKLFTSDGFVMQPGRPPARGTDAIEKAYLGRGGPLALRALHLEMADSVAYIIGGYAVAEGASDVGKFVLALRKDRAGRWGIVADIDNGNSR